MAYDLPKALAALAEAGGLGLAVVSVGEPLPDGPGVVRVGVHRVGPFPMNGLEAFDILLSADPAAPAPWVGLAPDALDAAIDRLQAVADAQPVAAGVAAAVYAVESDGWREVARVTLPAVPAGTSSAGVLVELEPGDVGERGLGARVDPDGVVTECDEENDATSSSGACE